ncbi:MAG: NAD(P)-dependent oxidoreductase [Verrucomicrobia bacterium]|nr:NAD(P)-dependent oxidoreductase [Verrucomicrobiota bacterium]
MSAPLPLQSARSPLPCPPEAIDDFIARPTPRLVAALARAPGPFLVLGAGGKIGLHLAIMLRRGLDQLGRTDRVIAVSRFSTLRDRADFDSRGIESVACDLTDPAGLAALPDAPTVFFLAGVKFGTASAPGLLHALNVEMPRRVASRFRHSRIVAFSSGCVYPFVPVDSGGATEQTPPEPIGDYAASCLAREQAFAAAAAQQGNPVALIRLNYSVEFRYGLLVDIAQRVLAREPIDVTMGHVNVIWQTDAVAHSIQALEVAGSPAVPINVTGPDTLSVRDLAHRFGAIAGVPVTITGTEAGTAWLNNAARSHRLFGPPLTSVETMMPWIVEWLRSGGETWGKPTGFERRDGRY